jgi:tripartite-type tricarboxylate transporter receptor subunit TctC
LLPDVPTTAEAGYGDVIGSAWNGIVAPAGTPKAIVDKLNAESASILTDPDTKTRFTELGMEAIGGSPQSFTNYLQAESDKWAKVIAAAHLRAP